MLPNKVYDVLKYILQIGLPALAALVFGLSNIWGIPYAEQIIGTIAVIETFLGILLGISTNVYNVKIKEKNDGENNTTSNK